MTQKHDKNRIKKSVTIELGIVCEEGFIDV